LKQNANNGQKHLPKISDILSYVHYFTVRLLF